MRFVVAAIVAGAACAEAFAPSPLALSSAVAHRSSSRRCPLALRMEDKVELKPLIDTKPIDYASEPTLFERQGLVENNVPQPKIYTPAMGGGEGFGGLSRREALGAAGAGGVGLVGVLWAVTRNPGYDKADTSRDAGKVTINAEEFAKPPVQAALALLRDSRKTLGGLYDAFNADKNVALAADVRKKFDVIKLRDSMNKLTFVFDEEVQIKTDKISRSLLQVHLALSCCDAGF